MRYYSLFETPLSLKTLLYPTEMNFEIKDNHNENWYSDVTV